VSLLWPERVTVSLEPHRVMVGKRAADADPEYGAEPWHGTLEALRREAAAWRKRSDVSVVLSNHFVRYAVLPPQDGAATAEEEIALARFQFTRIHGERVKGWEVRVSEELACAIDTALLEGIRSAFPPNGKARLVSVQPFLMTAYNRTRARIPREGAWLLLAEAGRTCLARIAPKGWASIYNGRETDADELLERERSRASGEALPSLVLKEQW
jgi:hypothetical protein